MAVGMCLAFCAFVCWEAHTARTDYDHETEEQRVSEATESAVQRIVITHVVIMASLGNLSVRSSELLQVGAAACCHLSSSPPSLRICPSMRCKTSISGFRRRFSAQWTC